MKRLNSLKGMLLASAGILFLGVGTWYVQENATIKATSKDTQSESVVNNLDMQTEVQLPKKIMTRALPPIENDVGLSAVAKPLILAQNATFPNLTVATERNKLLSSVVIPQPTYGAEYEYVTEDGESTIPNSTTAGFQKIYVKITENYTNTSIRVPVPVTITDAGTTLLFTNQVALKSGRSDGRTILYPNETKGKTAEELIQLAQERSETHAWNVETGEAVPATFTATTLLNNTVGQYTGTITVSFNGTTTTNVRNIVVFGADVKTPYYFTVEQIQMLDMGTNGANIFSKYRTLNTTTATNSVYEWVKNEAGEPTEPKNTFDTSKLGFHFGYIKMTDTQDASVSTVIPIPITVTGNGSEVVPNSKIGVGYNSLLFTASEIRGKTVPEITSYITNKIDTKAWSLLTGESLDTQVVSSTITQDTRGIGVYTIQISSGSETVEHKLNIVVTPDKVFDSEGVAGWATIPLNAIDGVITNPINGSKIGFPGRGIVGPSDTGFIARDKDGRGYVFRSGDGIVSNIPGIGAAPIYKNVPTQAWARGNGLGYGSIASINSKYYLRKGNQLKQILIDSTNNVMYVYNLSLAKNLNFNVQLDMYNLSSIPRNFSMLESVDTDYYSDSVNIYALENNSGFYLQIQSGDQLKRFAIKLKDNKGNWLSDYDRYYPGSYNTIGVSNGLNFFGNDFSRLGMEARNFDKGAIIVRGIDTAYQLGAPWKSIPYDEALKTGYELFAGDELPYMNIVANPESFNIYDDYAGPSLTSKYTLSKIAAENNYGIIDITYPTGEVEQVPFTADSEKKFQGNLTIPRDKLPAILNDKLGSIKTYQTSLFATDNTDGPMDGLVSEDYSVNINVYNLGATPIAQTVKKDSVWSKSAASLLTNVVIIPGHTPSYEFVDGIPDTSKIGLQFVKVRLSDRDSTTQPKIIEVPINVIDTNPPLTGLTVEALNITIDKDLLTGLSASEINQLILKESKAVAWDNATGLSAGITLSVDSTDLTASAQADSMYTAKIKGTNGTITKTKDITIKVTDITEGVLTVEFVNELNQVLPGYTITIDGLVGDTIDLTKEERVTDQLADLESAGYEIVERPGNETGIALNNIAVTVRYKIQGVLSLASAPNALDFGNLTYNATTKRVEDPTIDQPLIVTDTRAETTSGWRLTATLSTAMKNANGQELVNALRYVYKGEETILDTNAQVVYLNTTGSTGRFEVSNSWGTQKGTDGVKLQIGSTDTVYTGNYVGVITWKVMAGQP